MIQREPGSVVIYPALLNVMYILQRIKAARRLMCFNPCSFDSLVLELRDRFVTLETGQEPGSPREWTIAAPTRMQLQPSGASSLTFTPLSFKLALSKPVLSPPGEESFLPFPHEQTGG